jgi:hypothetical protein
MPSMTRARARAIADGSVVVNGTGGARTRRQREENRPYGFPRPFSRGAMGSLG